MRPIAWVRRDLIAEIRRDIWRYLTPSASIETELLQAAALLQLPPRELSTLGRLQFLTSEELGALIAGLPFLVRRLATTTASEEEWSPERIRGAIQWGRTLSVRHATGVPHMFVTSPARRAYQTPENELLVLVLDAVVSLGKQSGWYRSEKEDIGKLVSSRVADAERWRQMRALLEVERQAITPTKLARIRSGRHRRHYKAALVAYYRYRQLAQQLDRPAIRRAVETHGLITRADSTLFELIVTFRTIDALREFGWQLDPLRLLEGSLQLNGRKGNDRLDLWYQRTPLALRTDTAYDSALRAHGIAPRTLRPDLVIRHWSEHNVKWLLVEAKGGTSAPEELARRATFDLLAYRTAFAHSLQDQTEPFGLGVAWGAGLAASDGGGLMLCTHDEIRSGLGRFLG
jgi:hypothetical protein